MPFGSRARRVSGKLLLAVFLTGTIVLSVWLTYEAVDAARSHRRTAEGVLADYAGIAAEELSRTVADELDDFLDVLFDDVPRRDRASDLPGPRVMAREMGDALREARCHCDGLREGAAYFRVDLGEPVGEEWPESEGAERIDVVRAVLTEAGATVPGASAGLVPVEAGRLGPHEAVLAYRVTTDDAGTRPIAVYAASMEVRSFVLLFEQWYERAELLPPPLTGEVPGDSIVAATILTGTDVLFSTPRRYADTFSAADTLPGELGSLVVRASIRPDAAEQLIVGGLPSSRLPFLSVLLLLTVGLGIAALVQVHREHELARLRSDFVSGVSHEFRTPLTQIRLFAELLEGDKFDTEEAKDRAVAVIDREARRLTNLVENVLSFSAGPRARSGLPTEETDLGGVVEDVVQAFGPLADARDARLEVRIADGCRVRASRGAVHQVLTNLLDNALKYGPEGQTVTVLGESSDGLVRIRVCDGGPGVPPAERDRVWAPYHRLPRDVMGDVQGSGIGLAVVARLVDEHGGRAWVDSADEGGCFVVEMPASLPGEG